jgi:hypothetical protein
MKNCILRSFVTIYFSLIIVKVIKTNKICGTYEDDEKYINLQNIYKKVSRGETTWKTILKWTMKKQVVMERP